MSLNTEKSDHSAGKNKEHVTQPQLLEIFQ